MQGLTEYINKSKGEIIVTGDILQKDQEKLTQRSKHGLCLSTERTYWPMALLWRAMLQAVT